MTLNCRICENKKLETFIDFGNMPIVKNLKIRNDDENALYPFKLVQCLHCGFIQVEKPIHPKILYKNYINLSSTKRQPHLNRLLEVLEQVSHVSKQAKILDIGCNDGSFLIKMQSRGFSNLFGIEPAEDAYFEAKKNKINLHHGFFDENTAQKLYKKGSFDLVIARQVLEHISDLNNFIKSIAYVLKDNGTLCLEIPDFSWNIEYLDYALWEEHVNYFTLKTLKTLLGMHNFDIFHSETTLFSGRALTVFCKKCHFNHKKTFYTTSKEAINYKNTFSLYKKNLNQFLHFQKNDIFIYGCGTRSSNFVNFLNINKHIKGFIDDQKEKQNKFVPLSKIPVEKWSSKIHKRSTLLLGCNTENEKIVIENRKLSLKNVFSICPPSKLVPDFWVKLYSHV